MEKYNIKSNKMEYVWVINEPCEVILELSNPLNFELEVTNIVSVLFTKFFFFFLPLKCYNSSMLIFIPASIDKWCCL
jgi:hypothetical protein